jgi:pyruvate/2-oxoglutarate dehydrogenase complex dihydrolipoamide acyltransferase (E2) component
VVGQGFESPLRLSPHPGARALARIAVVLAQVIIDPASPTPSLNNGGWVYNAAILLAALGVIVALLLVVSYMRFAPRFQTDEGSRRRARAPRIQPGKDVRRPVNVISAPLIVQPPLVATVAAPAAAPAAVAASPAPAPAPAPVATAPAPAAAPAAAQAAAPAAAPAPAAEAAASTPTTTPAAEHKDVSLDQEVFDTTLAELLAKGTDRRVAEGQARRAAMIAARKKAEG